jgi:branched-subunit amino acid ABC-type transport system permease component
MILALVASGLTLIFGIMDVVNFAHGELFMLGAYMGVIVLTTTGSFWLALVLAIPDRRAARRRDAGDHLCARCSDAIP